MAEASTATATTEQPASHGAGFPPFDTKTFPSQIFWLAITFAALFVVLWRVAGPRISDTIAARRKQINGDIADAQKARTDAEAASAAYETALAGARARARAVAEENRKRVSDEVDRAKSAADAEAQTALSSAEARIGQLRADAKAHVTKAAQDAAAAIVGRLTGDTISADDAASAVRAADVR